jgi:hypothetical protein
MILKYKHIGAWLFEDYIDKIQVQKYDASDLAAVFNRGVERGDHPDVDQGMSVEDKLAMKQFMQSSSLFGIADKLTYLIDRELATEYAPVTAIAIKKIDDPTWSNTLILNDSCYLLNDDGRTIERLN